MAGDDDEQAPGESFDPQSVMPTPDAPGPGAPGDDYEQAPGEDTVPTGRGVTSPGEETREVLGGNDFGGEDTRSLQEGDMSGEAMVDLPLSEQPGLPDVIPSPDSAGADEPVPDAEPPQQNDD